MGRPRKNPTGMVVAREAMVVTVGARAPQWQIGKVKDRRTDQIVDVPLTEYPPLDPGSEGIAYAFKQYQRVHRSHPAVKESPGSFIDIEELDESEQELVSA